MLTPHRMHVLFQAMRRDPYFKDLHLVLHTNARDDYYITRTNKTVIKDNEPYTTLAVVKPDDWTLLWNTMKGGHHDGNDWAWCLWMALGCCLLWAYPVNE